MANYQYMMSAEDVAKELNVKSGVRNHSAFILYEIIEWGVGVLCYNETGCVWREVFFEKEDKLFLWKM